MPIEGSIGRTQQHRLYAGRRLNGFGTLRNLLADHIAVLALERVVAVAVRAHLAAGIDNRLGRSGGVLHGITRKEERGAHALFLEHLQNLLGGTTRPLVKRQRHDLLIALGSHTGASDHAIGGGHDLAAILRLARLLANPHLGAPLDAPGLHILDRARALDLEFWLDGRGLDLVLFVGIAAILNRNLLATRKLKAIPFALGHALAVHLYGQLFAPMALEHAIVDS